MRQNKYEYDAFISHAVEDKIPIANELCAKLESAGLKIWYSGKELGVGDSIEKTIEKGLSRSRYGIVIFSPTYLAKNWTIREFYTLLAKEIEEHKVILPVLYNVTVDDLMNKDLLMADRFAVNADRGIDFVVERLVREIRKPKVADRKVAWFSRMWLILILSLLANVTFVARGLLPAGAEEQLISQPIFRTLPQGQLMAAGLLNEMQGLVNQFTNCSCSRSLHNGGSAENNLPFVGNVTGGFHDTQEAQGAVHPARVNLHTSGGKLTMAVVFQIEAATEDQRGRKNDINRTPQTSKQEEKQGLFATVSNTPAGRVGLANDCMHTSPMIE